MDCYYDDKFFKKPVFILEEYNKNASSYSHYSYSERDVYLNGINVSKKQLKNIFDKYKIMKLFKKILNNIHDVKNIKVNCVSDLKKNDTTITTLNLPNKILSALFVTHKSKFDYLPSSIKTLHIDIRHQTENVYYNLPNYIKKLHVGYRKFKLPYKVNHLECNHIYQFRNRTNNLKILIIKDCKNISKKDDHYNCKKIKKIKNLDIFDCDSSNNNILQCLNKFEYTTLIFKHYECHTFDINENTKNVVICSPQCNMSNINYPKSLNYVCINNTTLHNRFSTRTQNFRLDRFCKKINCLVLVNVEDINLNKTILNLDVNILVEMNNINKSKHASKFMIAPDIIIHENNTEIIYTNKEKKTIIAIKQNLNYFDYYSSDINCELNEYLSNLNIDFNKENFFINDQV